MSAPAPAPPAPPGPGPGPRRAQHRHVRPVQVGQAVRHLGVGDELPVRGRGGAVGVPAAVEQAYAVGGERQGVRVAQR
ncbi:hypothetical protein, partial [Micromonospora aurantiaca (nom. illeg.)]|uniref:hypothetical protein n=1 Tax=Micromonospora aurantiaca (nom. illeg.) TaxID=47850 RepID=UPI003F4A1643